MITGGPLRILVALDDSDFAIHVGEAVLKLAKGKDTELHVLSVISEPTPLEADPEVEPQMIEKETSAFEETHSKLKQILAGSPEIRAYFVTIKGIPSKIICQEASSRSVDFILMGNRGRGKLKSALMGSVSMDVINNSLVPVIVVRQRQTAQEPPSE